MRLVQISKFLRIGRDQSLMAMLFERSDHDGFDRWIQTATQPLFIVDIGRLSACAIHRNQSVHGTCNTITTNTIKRVGIAIGLNQPVRSNRVS